MSVLLETSIGDLTLDLHTSTAPNATLNFIKLCKMKYYNDALFFQLQPHFTIACGDTTVQPRGQLHADEHTPAPHRPSYPAGGTSVFGLLGGDRFFPSEVRAGVTHRRRGCVSMMPREGGEQSLHASIFFITLADELSYLDKAHTIIGEVVDGLDEFIRRINLVQVDQQGKPTQNIKLRHTIILEDPFPDPPLLSSLIPPSSPPPSLHSFDFEVLEEEDRLERERTATLSEEELNRLQATTAAKSKAVVLEMLGDLPDADVAPPETILFVCKLNPVTRSEDLELIFSQCGEIRSCQILTDWKTGASLQYAFIEFKEKEAAERAYMKMNNVLIDERRIKVDFSQSVSKQWNQYRRDKNKTNKPKSTATTAATTTSTNAANVRVNPPHAASANVAPAAAAAVPARSSAQPSAAAPAPSASHAPSSSSSSSSSSSHRSHEHRSSHRSRSRSPRHSSSSSSHPRRHSSRDRSRSPHHHRSSRRSRSRSRSTGRHRHSRSRSRERTSRERTRSPHSSSHRHRRSKSRSADRDRESRDRRKERR